LLGHGRWQQVRVITSERPTCCVARNVAGSYDTASLDPALPIPAERPCWVQGPGRRLHGPGLEPRPVLPLRADDLVSPGPQFFAPYPGRE